MVITVTFARDMVLGAVGFGALGSVALDHGLFRRLSEFLDTTVYRGSGQRRSLALTFDDGPGPQTLEVLRLLRQHGVRATFFQCGMQVERYPEITRQVLAEGHQLGNHTWSHPSLSPSLEGGLRIPTPLRMYRELASTQAVLQRVTGQKPILFRPPYGHRWIGLDLAQRQLGLLGIKWTVIGHDWEWHADRIVSHLLERITPGAIVCLHDGRDVQPVANIRETLTALQTLLPTLLERGYRFETVAELLQEH